MSNNKPSDISIWDDFSEKIESLREALNTPIDENDSSGNSSKESDLLYHYTENDAGSLGTSVSETIESLREILNSPIDETISSDKPSEESNLPSQNGDQDATNLSPSDNSNKELDEVAPLNMTEILTETAEETDTDNETDLDDITAPNSQIHKTDESDELDYKQESQDVEETININHETDLDDIIAPNIQIHKTDESDELDYTQEIQDVEIKINTKQSIKSEKIDNYWKKSETANPYILKVDESREELNRSLKMARELANQQSEEPEKQEKKRFQLRFTRESKNENHKSNTGKVKEKHSKNITEFKPMVYEMLEPKQENQDNHANQGSKGKQDNGHKEKTKQLDDRAKNSQEKEIINHRNRLEKSRSLGVPVFVKKPVNLEQIRQLKSMLISQNNVKILVDTGSSQGRLLVISGQDPDTLLNTLSQLPIVKSTTVDDETINIVLENSD